MGEAGPPRGVEPGRREAREVEGGPLRDGLDEHGRMGGQAVACGGGSEDLLDQGLERQILRRQRPDEGPPRPRQHLEKAGIRVEPEAKGDLLREAADEAVELLAVAVGDDGGQQQVVAPDRASREDPDGGEQRHEDRRAPALRQVAHGEADLSREREHDRSARALGGSRRQGGVGDGKLGHERRPDELAPPERELADALGSCEALALPGGDLVVSDGRLRERGRPPRGEGAVERAELAPEDAHRPLVERQAVRAEDEDVIAVAEPQQRRLEQRPLGEVAGAPAGVGHDAVDLGRALRGGEAREVTDRHDGPRRRVDPLAQLPAAELVGGAQRPVTPDDLRERPVEGAGVQRSPDAPREPRHVLAAGGEELVPEQALLSRRDRAAVSERPLHRGRALLSEVEVDRRVREGRPQPCQDTRCGATRREDQRRETRHLQPPRGGRRHDRLGERRMEEAGRHGSGGDELRDAVGVECRERDRRHARFAQGGEEDRRPRRRPHGLRVEQPPSPSGCPGVEPGIAGRDLGARPPHEPRQGEGP